MASLVVTRLRGIDDGQVGLWSRLPHAGGEASRNVGCNATEAVEVVQLFNTVTKIAEALQLAPDVDPRVSAKR
jgi:hypothetical protein